MKHASTHAPDYPRASVTVSFLVASVLLVLAMVVAPSFAVAQSTFEPIPPSEASRYHVDFEKLFFPSADAEAASRSSLEQRITRFESEASQAGQSAEKLLAALKAYESILIDFYRHDDYLWLRYNVDVTDRASGDASGRLESAVNEAISAFEGALRRVQPEKLRTYETSVPALAGYASYVESVRRGADHVLDPAGEKLLARLAPLTTGWQYSLYSDIRHSSPFGTIDTENGSLDVLGDYGRIRVDPDPRVRAEGFEQLMAGFRSRREMYAFALIRSARARNRLAELRHFDDAPTAAYFQDYLSEEHVTQLLDRVAAAAETNKGYEALLANRYKAVTGAKEAHSWDRHAPLAGTPSPRFTLPEATAVIEAALAPLGTEYGEALAGLLNPANGRMDVVPGPNRRSGGFSTGFVGTPSTFYTSGYQGYYTDMGRLTHESTHAIQRTLMTDAGISPVYAEGPHLLAESFAEFSELLLADYLYRKADTPALQAYYLRRFLDIKGIRELYSAAAEASLEQKIYTGVQDGSITDADDLDSLTLDNDARFSMWPGRDAGLEGAWMTKTLFFEDPFYTVNYVYAALLAIRYLDMYEKDPASFAERYVRLMREGYTAPPDTLLERRLGIDLYGKELLPDALAAYQERVDALRRLYGESQDARR